MCPQILRRVPNLGDLRGFFLVFLVSLHIAPIAHAGTARFRLEPLGPSEHDAQRADAQLIADGDDLYIVHALADSAQGAPVEKYNVDRDTFEPLAGRLTPRSNAALVIVNHTLVVLGGEAATGATALVETMNLDDGEVQVAPALPSPRTGARAVVQDGLIVVLGGGSGWGETDETLLFDLRAQRWHRISIDSARDTIALLPSHSDIFAAQVSADGTDFSRLSVKQRAFSREGHVDFACDRLVAPLASGLICLAADGRSALFRPGKGVKAGPRLSLPQSQSAVGFGDGLAVLDADGGVLLWSRAGR